MYKAAALDFSNATGVRVHDTWGLTNHEELQIQLNPVATNFDQDFAVKLYNQFDLPPATEMIDKYHAVMGVISQYNRDDIEYFMTTPLKLRDPYRKIRVENIENHFNTQMYWVASPKTLTKIESKMHGKFQHAVRRVGYEHSI